TTSATTPSNGIVWVGFEVDSSSFVTVFKSVAVQKLWFPHTYCPALSTASSLGLATTFPNLLIYYNTSQIPLAPSTLTTSAISNSQIRLNWSTSTGATWYKIDRESPQGAGFSTIVVNTTNSTTHYDDTGLAAGTQYNYRVWAGNGTGTSTNASPTSATYTTQNPTVSASPVSGTYNSIQSVTLTASEPSTIYYTTDGTTPTISSPVYSSPVSISTTSTLKFFEKDTAGNIANTVTASYTISIPDTTAPVITPTGTVSINNNQTGFSTTNWTGDLFVGKFTNVPAGAKITAVGINVATAAGNIRVKVFDDNAGLPNNLLAESASIPVPGRGIQSISLTTSATTPSNGIVWVGFEVDSSSFVTVFKSVAVQKLWFPHPYDAGPSTASALGLAPTCHNLLIYYNTIQIPLQLSILTT